MKQIIAAIVISYLLFLVSPKAHADSYGTYGGGGTPTDLTINKEVQNPVSSLYVENLGSSDPTFSPGSNVTFRLTVKNGSGQSFTNVVVKDTLPVYLSHFSSNIPATYDATTRVVTADLGTMIAGEQRSIELTGKVADSNAFVSDRTIFCVTNYAKVTATQRSDGDDDIAELCIQTSVSGAQYLPVAGFNDLATIIPFLSLGAIGTFLLRAKQK